MFPGRNLFCSITAACVPVWYFQICDGCCRRRRLNAISEQTVVKVTDSCWVWTRPSQGGWWESEETLKHEILKKKSRFSCFKWKLLCGVCFSWRAVELMRVSNDLELKHVSNNRMEELHSTFVRELRGLSARFLSETLQTVSHSRSDSFRI